ncbi:MAG: hypothetical protein LBO78_01530, partial [Rickettsiales bacterium]|nr:hypothetical protein [Rickettsiales bacterium]
RGGAGGAFRRIKGIFSGGAAAAEVALPVDFLDPGSRAVPPDARECLDAVAEAGAGRPLKFSIETGFIGSPSAIARMVGLLSGCGAGCVKTASGLYPKMSSISDLNAALSALDAMGEGGAGLDFLFDPKLANRFVIDDAFRLAGKVCGAEFAWDGRFSVSVPFEIL